jgi:DNA polymerase-3 subunit epsilon
VVDDDLERMASALQRTGRYEVLRKFEPRRQYAPPDGSQLYTALAVDVETTGTDCYRDHIIQFSGVPFQYSPKSGQIYAVGQPVTYFEDPGVEISPAITALTSITAEQVRGQRIDDEAVTALANSASLVIAHNARFDRCFLERRLPIFEGKAWACSLTDVPWPAGAGSTKLEFLLYKHCGMFFAAHMAEADCLALIHLLATPIEDGQLPMALLLKSARRKTVRIWATNAPFEKKDLLKARHYVWSNGENGRPKAWHRDLPEAEVAEELDWLRDHVYAGRTDQWTTETYGAQQRFSNRV